MTDELKYLITETNTALGVGHNIVTFDALSAEGLLQLLIDVLAHFQIMKKIDAKSNDRDDSIRQILEALQKIQYRPHMEISDPVTFRQSIYDGDKNVIYSILRYVFEHKDNIPNFIYLARFLLPLDVPPEAMAHPDVANLWNEYLATMEEFKIAHKSYTEAEREELEVKRLRNELKAIEAEKENVKKRIEIAQARLDKIPQHELLVEAADGLRIEKERHKALLIQIEEKEQELERSEMLQQTLETQIANESLGSQESSPRKILDSMQKEIEVLNFMVDDKLPRDIQDLEEEIEIMKEVLNEPDTSPEYVNSLRLEVEELTQKIQEEKQKQLAESEDDPLIPYRQQVSLLSKKHDMAAEQLKQLTIELSEAEATLQENQKLLRETAGENVPQGEELKEYVNKLREKSSLYKAKRAELATVQAEANDLAQTLEKLKERDPTIASMLSHLAEEDDGTLEESDMNLPIESMGTTELARLIEGLKTAVEAARERIKPLAKQIRPKREKIEELQAELELTKNAYLNMQQSIDAEEKAVQDEIEKTEKSIKALEDEWKDVQLENEQLESLLERLRDETNNKKPEGGLSVIEELQKKILEEQESLKELRARREELMANEANDSEQYELWKNVEELMKVKKQCIEEAKARGIGGTISIAKDSETFTLNN